jgi:hypothetical protein
MQTTRDPDLSPVILQIQSDDRYLVAAADMLRYYNDRNLPDELKYKLGLLYAQGGEVSQSAGAYRAHDFNGTPRYIIHVTNETYQQLRGVKRDTRG